MRFWELGKRNFNEVWRDKTSFWFLLGMPLALILLLNVIWGGGTSAIPVGVVDQDRSPTSQAFVEILEEVPILEVSSYDDPNEASEALKFGDIKAFVTIPQGFGQQVNQNRQGVKERIFLNIAYDKADPLSAQQIGAVIRETATRFSEIELPLIINEEEVQPKSGVTNFLAPGLMVFGLMILISISAGMMVGDKERGFLPRLLTTPIRPSEFVAAYALPFIAVAIIQLIIFIGVGVLIGLKIHGSIPLTFLIFFLTAVCSIGIGMILGSLAKSKTQSDTIAWVIILFSAFLSGAWVPLNIVPSYWRSVAYALPFAHATDATRAILTKGVDFGIIATDFYWLIGWMVALFAAGIILFRGRMVARE